MTFTERSKNDPGHLDDTNMLLRAYDAVVWMPPPDPDPSVNVAHFNEAVARATVNRMGGTILFPPQHYVFNSTLRVRNVLGLQVLGCGLATWLEFNVATGTDWVTIEHSQHVSWGHMYLTGAGAGIARAAFALLRTDTPGSIHAPSQNHIRNVLVDCFNQAESVVTIGGADANNDFHTFDRSVFQNYTQRGIDLRYNPQSYGNEFHNIRMYAGAGALYGIDMSDNVGATFAWHGGIMSGHQEADFRLGRSYQPVSIGGGFHSENSKRFIIAGSACMIAARDYRWSGNAAHEDGRMMIVSGGGTHLTLENGSLGDGNNPTRALTIDLPSSILRLTSMRNHRVYSSAAAVFPNGAPEDLFGNDQITDERAGIAVPLTA